MSKANEKTRFNAMKRYYRYDYGKWKAPYENVMVCGKKRNVFFDTRSFTVTKEALNGIEPTKQKFMSLDRYLDTSNSDCVFTYDMSDLIQRRKENGYRYKISDVKEPKPQNFIECKGKYYNLPLIDKAFSIIDDGELATIYHYDKLNAPLLIETSIGVSAICPIRLNKESIKDTLIEKVV